MQRLTANSSLLPRPSHPPSRLRFHAYPFKQDNHRGLIGMAAFMGLNCSDDDALRVWWSHHNANPHGDYNTYGLEGETLVWMNDTMARLLPPALAARWAITPTDL